MFFDKPTLLVSCHKSYSEYLGEETPYILSRKRTEVDALIELEVLVGCDSCGTLSTYDDPSWGVTGVDDKSEVAWLLCGDCLEERGLTCLD